MLLDVTTAEQVAELVRTHEQLRVAGGQTKTATSSRANVSLAGLTGVLQYDPAEFTFTARAGTRLDEVEQMLAGKNQYLPFDPPLVEAGATLGGTVAAGLSGAGRFRYGGVRDFLLGVQIVTGHGEIVSTGSKVVKNAAGFDFPKLMVGSLGSLGVMTELTFKVFPAPQSTATVVLETDNLPDAEAVMKTLATSQLDLACLDLDSSHQIWARLAGLRDSVQQRAQRVWKLGGERGRVLTGAEDKTTWRACGDFQWLPQEHDLIKVAITPDCIVTLVEMLDELSYRISSGGHLAWLAWPRSRSSQDLNNFLRESACPAVALTGEWANPWLGEHRGEIFRQRLAQSLDPQGKFRFVEPASV
jgi:glycolate oxidase FAD binding subunit